MKKGLSILLIALSITIISNYAAAACLDNDGDTYGITFGAGDGCLGGAEDCNDNDAFINPGATELCGNGVDDNCNAVVDEGNCCADFDHDGYGNPESGACTKPGVDCNNNNPLINPGLSESTFDLCIDGIDNNCNGLVDRDDPACAEFYPAPAQVPVQGVQAPVQGAQAGAAAPGQGAQVCTLSSPVWTNAAGEVLASAKSGEEISLAVFGESCQDETITFSITSTASGSVVEEAPAVFGESLDAEGMLLSDMAVYTTTAPQETGEYTFKAEATREAVLSDSLTVTSAEQANCEVQWDCSAIDFGKCENGIMSREICPGNEGTSQCCADEASCLCTAAYPEGTCEQYTYARPQYQKTCAAAPSGFRKVAREEREVFEGQEPSWLEQNKELLIAGLVGLLVIIGGIIYFVKARAPGTAVPASLLNYIKAAREKKATDSAIKEALTKSGWKPEQINAAFKRAK